MLHIIILINASRLASMRTPFSQVLFLTSRDYIDYLFVAYYVIKVLMKKLTMENFEQVARSERGLFVIQFYSDTCMPCKTMEPVMAVLNEKNPTLNVYQVNTMADPELAQHFGVMGVPNIVFCEDREVLYRFTGVTPIADMQYVIDNKDDAHLRATGEFKIAEKKPDLIFGGVIIGLVLLFLFLFFIK